MCKYEIDPASIVEDKKWTQFQIAVCHMVHFNAYISRSSHQIASRYLQSLLTQMGNTVQDACTGGRIGTGMEGQTYVLNAHYTLSNGNYAWMKIIQLYQ